jgi:HlyD family secretion protein
MMNHRAVCPGLGLLLLLALAACGKNPDPVYQGYGEGEYLYIAPEAAGRLVELRVARGDLVKQGDLLYVLDEREATIARDQARADLAEAEAKLADLGKGARPEELAVYEAQQAAAEAQLAMDLPKLQRREQLRLTEAVTLESRDEAAAAVANDRARIAEAAARIASAKLAGRSDAIVAAEAVVAADRSRLAEAERALAERRVFAPTGGVIDDTLYRLGEQIAANAAVLTLLPPENMKVRFFLPETILGRVHVGDKVRIACDSCPPGMTATISFISSQAEFTPPVIYSVGTRDKLVYLIEARPDRDPLKLHPGQPIDVRLGAFQP